MALSAMSGPAAGSFRAAGSQRHSATGLALGQSVQLLAGGALGAQVRALAGNIMALIGFWMGLALSLV